MRCDVLVALTAAGGLLLLLRLLGGNFTPRSGHGGAFSRNRVQAQRPRLLYPLEYDVKELVRCDEGSRQGVVSWMMSLKDRLTMPHDHHCGLPPGQDLMVRDGMLKRCNCTGSWYQCCQPCCWLSSKHRAVAEAIVLKQAWDCQCIPWSGQTKQIDCIVTCTCGRCSWNKAKMPVEKPLLSILFVLFQIPSQWWVPVHTKDRGSGRSLSGVIQAQLDAGAEFLYLPKYLLVLYQMTT